MKNTLLLLRSILLLLFFIPLAGSRPGPSEADTGGESSDAEAVIPEIVVTATRDERPVQDTPHAATVLKAQILRIETPVRTVPEAFKNTAGTMVQKTGHGQGSPYIRGFTGYRNLFLINGIRLNNSVFRDGPNQYWNTVDALGLSRMELVRGPFSMLYGSDAVGGTVNAITRGAQDIAPGRHGKQSFYSRYASAENSSIARIESIGRLNDRLVATLGYSIKRFGDVEGGKDVGTQEKTGYDEQDWDAKLELFLDDQVSLILAHQHVDIDDAWRTHKTIYGIDWQGLSVGKELHRMLDQDRDLTYLQFHRRGGRGFVHEIRAGISYHRQAEERDRLRTEDRRDIQGFEVNTTGAFVTLTSASPLGRLIYGVEIYHDKVDSYKRALNPDGSVKSTAIQGPVGDDATYDLAGIYLQNEIALVRRASLLLGGRYEYARGRSDKTEDPLTGQVISVSDDWNDLVGSVRIRYDLDRDRSWNVFAGISQGFRAPNLSDLTRFDSARTDEIETPTPGLDPEHFVSCEAGSKIQTASLWAQLSCFYTRIDGMIVRMPTGRIIDGDYEVTKKNSGDGHIQGVELDVRCRPLRRLTVFGLFSWLDGDVETYSTSDAALTTEPIDRLMPPTGRFGLRWAPNGRYWIESSCTAAVRADRLSTRDRADDSRIPPGGTPGYTVFDIRAGWRWGGGLKLSLGVENIADEDYRIHGSGVNEPGRNIVLATELTF